MKITNDGGLSNRWKTVTLNDVADIIRGVSYEGKDSEKEEKENYIPILRAGNITSSIIYDNFIYIPEKYVGKKQYLEVGDILIATSSGSKEIVGKAAQINQNKNMSFGAFCCVVRPKEINPQFLYHYFQSIHYKLFVKKTLRGANINNLRISQIRELKIQIPPLETQRRIVSILEKAEETKRLRSEADELTDKFLQAVFLEMFGDPITNSKKWQTKKLGNICLKIMGGGTPSKSKLEYYIGNIPWVTPKDMKDSYIRDTIDHISEKAIKESTTNLIPTNSLLMVIRSGILKRKLPIAINNCAVTINQDMKAFIFKTDITNTLYMFYFFMNYQKYLLKKVRSVTADNLEFDEIKNINVILPPITLQQKFASIAEKVEAMRATQKESKQEIENLFNALMQKAFKGELVA